jgi:hypothetical protein
MKVGIIAEGKADLAVITNILKGRLNISKSDIQYLVPELEFDETSLFQMRPEQFSTWTVVKKSCENRNRISEFIQSFDDERFLIIHIDSDTRNEVGFEVSEPKSITNIEDIKELRSNISLKMQEWLQNEFIEKIVFAIAIQEIDSWILAIYLDHETGMLPNAKERLTRILNNPRFFSEKARKKIFSLEQNKLAQYALLSEDFRKRKGLNAAILKNYSLKVFCEELDKFS